METLTTCKIKPVHFYFGFPVQLQVFFFFMAPPKKVSVLSLFDWTHDGLNKYDPVQRKKTDFRLYMKACLELLLQTGQRWKVHRFLLSHSEILEILPVPTPSVPSTLSLNDELSAQCAGVQCCRWQQRASTLKQLPSQHATSYRGHSDLDITVMHRRLLSAGTAIRGTKSTFSFEQR